MTDDIQTITRSRLYPTQLIQCGLFCLLLLQFGCASRTSIPATNIEGQVSAPAANKPVPEPCEDWRLVHLQEQSAQLHVPYHWEVRINERKQNASMFSAQETNESGAVTPLSINIFYRTRNDGLDYPIPPPDSYATVYADQLRRISEEVEVIESREFFIEGAAGCIVELRVLRQGMEMHTYSVKLIASNPSRMYTITAGTMGFRWEQDQPTLMHIINSIRID